MLLGLKGTMSHPFIPFYIIHKDSDNREEFHSFSNLDDEPFGVFIKNWKWKKFNMKNETGQHVEKISPVRISDCYLKRKRSKKQKQHQNINYVMYANLTFGVFPGSALKFRWKKKQ